MKFERIEKPNYSLTDTITSKSFNGNIAEVTQMHYDAKPVYNPDAAADFKKPKFKTKYKLSRELKRGRDAIFNSIAPDDLPYTFFLTLTRANLNKIADAYQAWHEYRDALVEKYGEFEYFAFFEKSKTSSYHIHVILWDPNHSQRFEYLNFKSLDKMWLGEAKVSKIKDYESLIRIAFYCTKKDKHQERVLSDEVIWESSREPNDEVKSKSFDASDIEGMKELFSTSYRLYTDDKKNDNPLDVSITRTLYVKEDLLTQ